MAKKPLYPSTKGKGGRGNLAPATPSQREWEIEFSATFYRLGRDEKEARANAKEFIDKLILLDKPRIISIRPTQKWPH